MIANDSINNTNNNILTAFFRYYKSLIITNIGSISVIAAISYKIFESVSWFEHYGIIFFILMLLGLSTPTIYSFIKFWKFNRKYDLIGSRNRLFESTNLIQKSENKFEVKYSLYRIDRATTSINELLNGHKTDLIAFQNYEYIRQVFSMILENILEEGDHYFTLSNLDFWTQKPFEESNCKELIKINTDAAENGRYIHRVIIIKKSLITSINKNNLTEEQERLKQLLKIMFENKTLLNNQVGNPISTIFYTVDDNDENLKALAFSFVVSEDLNYLMITMPFGLENINTPRPWDNKPTPKILSRYPNLYKCENLKEVIYPIIKPLKILQDIEKRIKKSKVDINKFPNQDEKVMSKEVLIQRLIKCYELIETHDPNIHEIKDLYHLFF